MVDPIQYPMRHLHHTAGRMDSEAQERAALLVSVEIPSNPTKICSCKWCEEQIYSHAAKPRFMGYSEIVPVSTESLTDHQYFLCDQAVEAFLFKTRQWGTLSLVSRL